MEAHTWPPESGLPPASAFHGVEVVFNLAGEPVAKGRSKEVVDAVAASLGLPAPVGPLGDTPASQAARSLALLLDRRMNDRRRLDVRNGCSEDGWSAALAPWVSEVPGFAPLAAVWLRPRQGPSREAAMACGALGIKQGRHLRLLAGGGSLGG